MSESEKIKEMPFIRLYKCPKCSEIFSLTNGRVKSTIVRGYPDEDSDIAKCPECGHMGVL